MWMAATGSVLAAPTVVNDVVYIADGNGDLSAFDASGITGCSHAGCEVGDDPRHQGACHPRGALAEAASPATRKAPRSRVSRAAARRDQRFGHNGIKVPLPNREKRPRLRVSEAFQADSLDPCLDVSGGAVRRRRRDLRRTSLRQAPGSTVAVDRCHRPNKLGDLGAQSGPSSGPCAPHLSLTARVPPRAGSRRTGEANEEGHNLCRIAADTRDPPKRGLSVLPGLAEERRHAVSVLDAGLTDGGRLRRGHDLRRDQAAW